MAVPKKDCELMPYEKPISIKLKPAEDKKNLLPNIYLSPLN